MTVLIVLAAVAVIAVSVVVVGRRPAPLPARSAARHVLGQEADHA